MGITNLLFFLPGVGIVTTFGMWISGSVLGGHFLLAYFSYAYTKVI